MAVFPGLSLSNTGGGYTLALTSGALTPATFGPFSVTPVGQAIELEIGGNPPTTVAAGSPFSVTIKAVDGFGHQDTSFNGNITLALANNPDGSTLGGTVTLAASSGVAVFSTTTLNRVGTGYTLTASNSSLLPTTTSPVTVIPGAATQLVIAGEPPAIDPVFTDFGLSVIAEDADGNLATGFSGNVSVALAAKPNAATLGGTLAVAASAGTAVFSDLTTNLVGSGYTLQVSSPGLTSATSTAFSTQPATLTITGQANDVVTIAFSDATDFSVAIDGGTPTSYSTASYAKVVYNGPAGAAATVIFQDPISTDDYTATQSLAATQLIRSGGTAFEFDANSVSTCTCMLRSEFDGHGECCGRHGKQFLR